MKITCNLVEISSGEIKHFLYFNDHGLEAKLAAYYLKLSLQNYYDMMISYNGKIDYKRDYSNNSREYFYFDTIEDVENAIVALKLIGVD